MKLSLPVMCLPVILSLGFAWAAGPQSEQTAREVPNGKIEAPALPAIEKLKIRDEQHKIDALQIQFSQYQQVLRNLQDQFQTEQKALDTLVEDAYKSAKADKKDFTLDLDKLEFAPVLPPKH